MKMKIELIKYINNVSSIGIYVSFPHKNKHKTSFGLPNNIGFPIYLLVATGFYETVNIRLKNYKIIDTEINELIEEILFKN